jgi:hypothetical protein
MFDSLVGMNNAPLFQSTQSIDRLNPKRGGGEAGLFNEDLRRWSYFKISISTAGLEFGDNFLLLLAGT